MPIVPPLNFFLAESQNEGIFGDSTFEFWHKSVTETPI